MELLPEGNPAIVRVIVTLELDDAFTHYNPETWHGASFKAWLFGPIALADLAWDPADYSWKKQGSIKACAFFSYSTKLGYKIGLTDTKNRLNILQQLWSYGFKATQTRHLMQRVWHPWIPHKIGAMNWLAIAEGLPIGA